MRIWLRGAGFNEIIYVCQRGLEGIAHARLELEARSWRAGQV